MGEHLWSLQLIKGKKVLPFPIIDVKRRYRLTRTQGLHGNAAAGMTVEL